MSYNLIQELQVNQLQLIQLTTASTSSLGGGHFQVPLALSGRQSNSEPRTVEELDIKMGNMVGAEMEGAEMEGAEMEGAEMEGAMMQSQEVIKELYDALIAQGLSPQEAIEKIKEMIASTLGLKDLNHP